MSFYNYKDMLKIRRIDYSFYGLIMAAMQKADDKNLEKLKSVFPEVFEEAYARYNAPYGLLPSDPEPLRNSVMHPQDFVRHPRDDFQD